MGVETAPLAPEVPQAGEEAAMAPQEPVAPAPVEGEV